MAHHHGHGHHHHHHPAPDPGQTGRAFLVGIVLNLVFVIVEVVAGWQSRSLALLTDAGHNLSDVGTLVLSLAAFRLSGLRPTRKFSYGFGKSTVLASLANALILLVAVGVLGVEAVRRLDAPPEVPGLTVALVAGIGIAINSFTAWLFYKDQKTDLNIKGAYLHLAADAAVSAGVVLSGVLMYFTRWSWIDPLISFVILGVILWSTWGLLRDSMRLSLDGVPAHIDPAEIRQAALRIPGILDVHHIHIWPISTTETALTAHLVMADDFTPEQFKSAKDAFRHALLHLDIGHATLEIECEHEACAAVDCGPVEHRH